MLYLPIVPSKLNAFDCIPKIYNEATNPFSTLVGPVDNMFKIYFNKSPLNSRSEFTHAAIKFSSGSNTNPILNKYPLGIYIALVKDDVALGTYIEVPAHIFISIEAPVTLGANKIPKINGADIYYSQLESINGINQNYISQIKLLYVSGESTTTPTITTVSSVEVWKIGTTTVTSQLLESISDSSASEWSSQVSIRPINIKGYAESGSFIPGYYSTPNNSKIGIQGFSSRTNLGALITTNVVSSEFYPFQFNFPANSIEAISAYKFTIQNINSSLFEETSIIQVPKFLSQNSFTWTNTKSFVNGTSYYLSVYFETVNGFAYTIRYRFTATFTSQPLSIIDSIDLTSDPDNSRIELKITPNGTSSASISTISILRSSASTGIDNYYEIASLDAAQFKNNTVAKYFYDYFIEPGILYKYKIQGKGIGFATEAFPVSGNIIQNTTGSFIIGAENIQLNLTYNGEVSSFREVKKDAIIETIGGKYPFVIRSSDIGYKQFGFNGMIVNASDPTRTLIGDSYSELISNSGESNTTVNTIYTDFISSEKIEKGFNYILEKQFRKKLLDWLNDGQVKVFKSDTEGLFLVRITDVSLEPVKETGRVLYSFSSTITEVAEYSLANLIKYGIAKSLYSNLSTASDIGLQQDSF